MSARPLTTRMQQAMRALGRLEARPRELARPTTAAVIAHEVERTEGAFALIEATTGGAKRGSGVRVMNAAQRFIAPLRSLERRQLVARVQGGSYILTDHGEEWVEEHAGREALGG